jgi:phosphatidate cytidylyltransferase
MTTPRKTEKHPPGMIPAVITAGGRLTGELADRAGTEVKALAPMQGRPLIAAMLDALLALPQVGPLAVVGPTETLSAVQAFPDTVTLVTEGETGPENVLRGLDAVAEEGYEGYVLVCTCDLPFINAEAVRWLLDNAPDDADIIYPIVTKQEYLEAFPGSPNAWAKIAGEELTGGSVLLMRPAAVRRNRELIERVFNARKSQWEMARLLGVPFLIRFLTGRLTVAQAEARASRLTGCRCRALRGGPPHLASDIDTLADYEWAIVSNAGDGKNETGNHEGEHGLMALLDELAKEAQERALGAARDAQERVREAQEKALELARERAREAQERARKAAETMPPGLLVRLASSLVGIPLLILLVFAEGTPGFSALPFTGAVAICATVGAWEYFSMLYERNFRPSKELAYIAVVLLQLAAWSVSRGYLSGFLPGLLAVLVIATLIHQVLRRDPEPLANIGVTFLGVVYIGWLFSYLIFLRSIPGSIFVPLPFLSWFGIAQPEMARGAWMVLYVIAVTWSTDTGAYFVGSKLGKRPLAPSLSPKKSYEGAIGGLAAATIMSLAWGTWIGLPWYHCALLGPVIGILGQVGDLCESALKRDLGVKDFGKLLPGHGGILDRFDSLLFTAPVAYYYLSYFVMKH